VGRDKDKTKDRSQQNDVGSCLEHQLEQYSERYYVSSTITPICRRLILTGERKLVIQADNSRCHTAKVVLDFVSQKEVRFAQDPPYSRDIAPSDFSIFRCLKRELPGSCFQTTEELLAELRKLVNGILPEILMNVFATGLHGAKV
jgi:hypothetical protein